jgi:quercetin dioxygenase-like cupin family protein
MGVQMLDLVSEYGFLLEREVVLYLVFEERRLTQGDAVCFESSTPHAYRNEGDQPAVGVWFVREGGAG